MKKTVIASLAVLAIAAVVATFALGGAGKFGDVRVNADTKEYSVTFDASDTANTTVKAVDDLYAIGTTTAAGSKVGVVGWDNSEAHFTFRSASFHHLMLSHYDVFGEDEDAYPFRTITGFAISFSDGPMKFESDKTSISSVTSGTKYDVSLTPDDHPAFERDEYAEEGDVIITSLTLWYSC